MALYFLHLFLLFQSALAQVVIPAPSGRYAVIQKTAKLVDESRVDPWVPESGKRNVMISLFYPIERRSCQQNCTVDYMPPTTAALFGASVAQLGVPNGTFEQIKLQVCCKQSPSRSGARKKVPLVLFSPGLGGIRLMYSAVAQTLASAGYAVVTMDHTFEASVVEYPDGTYTPGLNASYWYDPYPGKLESALAVRVQDASFVLDSLSNSTLLEQLVPSSSCAVDVKRAAMFGHSFGGATSILALSKEPRFLGGLNMDGSMYGNLSSIHQPAVLFGRAEPNVHNRTNDATWADNWVHLKGWKSEIGLRNSGHNSFSDAPLWAKLFGMPVNDVLEENIGSLDGLRALDIVTTYVQAFMDFVLKGKKTQVFHEPNAAYPEIAVV